MAGGPPDTGCCCGKDGFGVACGLLRPKSPDRRVPVGGDDRADQAEHRGEERIGQALFAAEPLKHVCHRRRVQQTRHVVGDGAHHEGQYRRTRCPREQQRALQPPCETERGTQGASGRAAPVAEQPRAKISPSPQRERDRHQHGGRGQGQHQNRPSVTSEGTYLLVPPDRVQNWIGGSDYNPCSAAFVPAPPELVEQLMVDLVAFSNSNSLPAVAQAAVAHAQFETIHPFIDGNGRTGRALIHLILRRRGLAPRVLPPVSLILATWAKDYVGGLEASRYQGSSTTHAAHKGTNLWIGRFAGACTRAAADATSFAHRAQAIEAAWRDRLDKVRDRSASDLLLRALVGAPVVTVSSAADLIGRSFVQTNQAVGRLVEAGILNQVTVGRRNRAFEAPDIIEAFTDLERQLGSPADDTRTSEPIRRVPRRRQK
jgi:hypothetical protein